MKKNTSKATKNTKMPNQNKRVALILGTILVPPLGTLALTVDYLADKKAFKKVMEENNKTSEEVDHDECDNGNIEIVNNNNEGS